MTDTKQRARELLAAEYVKAGMLDDARRIHNCLARDTYETRALLAIEATLSERHDAGAVRERKGCGNLECGCDQPVFTEPMEALRFLSGRFKHAGVSEDVALSYARDIDDILAKHEAALSERGEAVGEVDCEGDVVLYGPADPLPFGTKVYTAPPAPLDVAALRGLVVKWRTEAARTRQAAGRAQRRGDGTDLELFQAAQDADSYADELESILASGGKGAG